MRKTATITAGLLLGASLFAGCGSDDGDSKSSSGGDYCDKLKSLASDIKPFTAENAEPDYAKFGEFIDNARELADEAPSEIEDAWKTMLGGMDALVDALEDAGIELEDFGKIAEGDIPEGVDPTKLAGLGEKLQELNGEDMEAAGEEISKHAKDECDVDLDSAS